jgi:hypothetical protein
MVAGGGYTMRGFSVAVATISVLLFVGVNVAEARRPLNVTGKLPKPQCTKDQLCSVSVNAGNLAFNAGDGPATSLNNFNFSVIQTAALIGKQTTWVANFDQYNQTQDTPAGFENVYIRFADKFGNLLPDIAQITLNRSNCGNMGHQTGSGPLGDIFNRGAVTYIITQQTLSAKVGKC